MSEKMSIKKINDLYEEETKRIMRCRGPTLVGAPKEHFTGEFVVI